MHSYHQFKIQQLRLDKLIIGIETIAVYIFAIMMTVFLPSLLYQFVFVNQQLTAEPPVVTYIPAASFGLAVLVSLYAIVKCLGKWQMIKKLEKDMMMSEMPSMSAPMMTEMEAPAPVRRAPARKAVAKKTTKK